MNDTPSWSPLFRVIGPTGEQYHSLAQLLESYPYLSGVLAGMTHEDDFHMSFRRAATDETISVTSIGYTSGDQTTPVEPDPAAPPSEVVRLRELRERND